MSASREIDRAQKANLTANRDWEPEFLEALGECGVIAYAAQAVGVHRRTVYRHRDSSPAFAEALEDALELSTAKLEREAFRRAHDGVVEPVVSAGKHVTDVTRYSDRLTEFLLRARRPDIYRERSEIHHSGSIGLTVTALAKKAAEGRREIESGPDDDD